jgi:hypothetical protein
MKQRPSKSGVFDLGEGQAGVEEMVISSPANYVSRHSGA